MNIRTANESFVISALLITLGYVLKRVKVLSPKTGEHLALVALNVTVPAIVLLNVSKVPLTGMIATLPLFMILHSLVMVGAGLFVFRSMDGQAKGLALASSSGYNIGLFAIPIVAGVYGAAGVTRFALIDMGNIIAIFVLMHAMAYRYSTHRVGVKAPVAAMIRQLLTSIPFLSYLIAIALNLFGVRITGIVEKLLEVPAAMNRGVSLIALGTLMRFAFPKEAWAAIKPPLILRYSFGLAFAAVMLFLVPLPLDLRVALAGGFVMPVGFTIVPYAMQYGYDTDRAAAILNIGVPISFALFWAVWAVGEYVLR